MDIFADKQTKKLFNAEGYTKNDLRWFWGEGDPLIAGATLT